MTKYLSCAETAKLMRAVLKEAFPGVKFSVRSSTYSGGASISVSYTDGPQQADVEAITSRFQGATFDGMIDLKSHHDSMIAGEVVSFGSDYVFVTQEISAGRKAAAEAAILTLDDRMLNNLEAQMNMGRFGHYADRKPMSPEHFDWAMFVRAVARATLPPVAAKALFNLPTRKPVPANDPLDDFNYRGSRHHY